MDHSPSGLTYNVIRHPGGWAVEYDDELLCCYRRQEQAIAKARLLGRERWRDQGAPSRIQVRTVTGQVRTEAVYGGEGASA